jgi:hypothetical protein
VSSWISGTRKAKAAGRERIHEPTWVPEKAAE